MTKLKSIEDRANMRSKNKIKKGVGREECLYKESIKSCGVSVNERRWQCQKCVL